MLIYCKRQHSALALSDTKPTGRWAPSRARKRMRTESGGYRREPPPRTRPTPRGRYERSSPHGGQKANCCARSSPVQAQKRQVLACPACTEMARPEGFEPPTPRFEVCVSIQPSYEAI